MFSMYSHTNAFTIHQCYLWALIFVCQIFNEGTSGGHFVNVFCHGTRERIHAHGNILENKPSIAMSTTSHSEVEMSRCKGVKDDTDDLLGALG